MDNETVNHQKVTSEWDDRTGVTSLPPSHLRYSPFRDEQEPNVYHLAIPIKGETVFAREMDDETFAIFQRERAPLQTIQEKAVRVESEAQKLDDKNQMEDAMALRMGMVVEIREMEKKNRKFTKWLCGKLLAGWSFARPFSPEAFAQLCGDTQQHVINEIVRASVANRDDSGFLADGSLTA
jgi:hypothetical protein